MWEEAGAWRMERTSTEERTALQAVSAAGRKAWRGTRGAVGWQIWNPRNQSSRPGSE